MFSNYKYKVSCCPICNQGIVAIVKEEKSELLYLCCDECMAEWTTPEDVGVYGKGSRLKFGKSIEPTIEDIRASGWDKYIQDTIS